MLFVCFVHNFKGLERGFKGGLSLALAAIGRFPATTKALSQPAICNALELVPWYIFLYANSNSFMSSLDVNKKVV